MRIVLPPYTIDFEGINSIGYETMLPLGERDSALGTMPKGFKVRYNLNPLGIVPKGFKVRYNLGIVPKRLAKGINLTRFETTLPPRERLSLRDYAQGGQGKVQLEDYAQETSKRDKLN